MRLAQRASAVSGGYSSLTCCTPRCEQEPRLKKREAEREVERAQAKAVREAKAKARAATRRARAGIDDGLENPHLQQLRDPDGWGINEPHFGGADGNYGLDGGWGGEMEEHEPPLLAPLRPPWMPQEEGEDGMVSDGRGAQRDGVEGTHAADSVGGRDSARELLERRQRERENARRSGSA